MWHHGFVPKALPLIDMSAPVCCAPVVAGGVMSDDDALHVALRLKALADPARVKIMSLLFASADGGEENSRDLAAAIGGSGGSRPSATISPSCAMPGWWSRHVAA